MGTVQKGPIRILPSGWGWSLPSLSPLLSVRKEEKGMVAELGGTKYLPGRPQKADVRLALSISSKKQIRS